MNSEVNTAEKENTIQAIIEARHFSGMTQKELAELTGISQADISRIENGSSNPSLRTLQRLAKGMGMDLRLVFTPSR